jgi:hypothetical protein
MFNTVFFYESSEVASRYVPFAGRRFGIPCHPVWKLMKKEFGQRGFIPGIRYSIVEHGHRNSGFTH